MHRCTVATESIEGRMVELLQASWWLLLIHRYIYIHMIAKSLATYVYINIYLCLNTLNDIDGYTYIYI